MEEMISLREYQRPWWVTVIHSIPRVDLTFEPVNATFDLQDPKYKEVIKFFLIKFNLISYTKRFTLNNIKRV